MDDDKVRLTTTKKKHHDKRTQKYRLNYSISIVYIVISMQIKVLRKQLFIYKQYEAWYKYISGKVVTENRKRITSLVKL